jgi:hypothetical protein
LPLFRIACEAPIKGHHIRSRTKPGDVSDENMVIKLASFAADNATPKRQSKHETICQDETNQLVAFFNLHLGRSVNADYWDKLESTMTFLSILGLRWLEMNGHRALARDL